MCCLSGSAIASLPGSGCGSIDRVNGEPTLTRPGPPSVRWPVPRRFTAGGTLLTVNWKDIEYSAASLSVAVAELRDAHVLRQKLRAAGAEV